MAFRFLVLVKHFLLYPLSDSWATLNAGWAEMKIEQADNSFTPVFKISGRQQLVIQWKTGCEGTRWQQQAGDRSILRFVTGQGIP